MQGQSRRPVIRPCLCGFEADTPNKMYYHRRFCAVWKGRDAEKVRQQRQSETWRSKGHEPKVTICSTCHRRLKRDKRGRCRLGHAPDCPIAPLLDDIRQTPQQRHAKVLGSNEVLRGLVQALAHRRGRMTRYQ